MNKTKLALCLSLFMVLLIVGCGSNTGNSKTGKLLLPTVTPQQQIGAAAIAPSSSGTITKTDVMNYVQTHNLPFNSAALSAHQVESISFITSKEVNTILNQTNTYIPDNYPLCLVTFFGAFNFPHPPVITAKQQPFTYNRAFEVFDAKTGNLLMGGGLPPLPQIGLTK